MFTGIVQNQASVTQKRLLRGQIRFTFRFAKTEKNLKLGESVAVDGVCLTVAKKTTKSFDADIVKETLTATTLSHLKLKNKVNIERSLKLGDEIGGHYVTGHIDGTGKIKEIKKYGKNYRLVITASPALIGQLARKGSVAIDGISLTVQKVTKREFTVAIIPHTLKVTTLGGKRAGDLVNLEIDLITRYLKVLTESMPSTKASKTTLKRLLKQGF